MTLQEISRIAMECENPEMGAEVIYVYLVEKLIVTAKEFPSCESALVHFLKSVEGANEAQIMD